MVYNIFMKLSRRIGVNLYPVIIVNFIFLLFWIIYKKDYISIGYITEIEILYNIIINPIYLFIINMIHSIKYKIKIYFINIFLMVISCLSGIIIHYFNWGITEHYSLLINPDGETLYIFLLMLLIIPIVIIIGLIEQIILLIIYKNKWKNES
jgi:hypothetical protein